jgi:hypothetical protein
MAASGLTPVERGLVEFGLPLGARSPVEMTQLVDERSSTRLVFVWAFGRASLAHELLGESRCEVRLWIWSVRFGFPHIPTGPTATFVLFDLRGRGRGRETRRRAGRRLLTACVRARGLA